MNRLYAGLLLTLTIALAATPVSTSRTQLDPHVVTFQIRKDGSATHKVELGGKTCTFEYSLGAPKPKPVEAPKPAPVEDAPGAAPSSNAIYNQLMREGICPETTLGYWTYKICLNGEIRQYHGPDTYTLGRYSEDSVSMDENAMTWTYNNGQPCEALPGHVPRKTVLKLACHPDSTGVGEVQESSTCVYEVTVYHPSVCANPKFPKQLTVVTSPPPSGAPASSADQGVEDWRMEFYKTSDGLWACHAQRVDSRFADFHFSSASLGFDTLNVEGFQSRAYHMKENPAESFELARKNEASSSDKFGGQLEFFKIVNSSGN